MNKFLKVFIIIGIIVSLINIKQIYADETNYEVFNLDGTKEVLLDTFSFDEAYTFYINNKDEYKNLCLSIDDDVLYMEYGTLYINSDSDKVTYYSLIKEKNVEITNFNEYDLLYIGEADNQVKFILENDIGYIDKSLVTYYPYGTRDISYFDIKNGSLYHHVASVINNYYKYNFMLDEALSFMKDNVNYFSYDTHFFYDDFYIMSDDYYSGTNENAINKDEPYYNYYAYLPARSYTNYNSSDFKYFINNILGISEPLSSYSDFDKDNANDCLNESALYDSAKAFISSEKIYGVNALSSLAFALLESNYGKSLNAFENNNLYSHNAFNNKEEEINKYLSINSSIYSHARNFVSRNYCDLFATYYVGSFIGDFVSGLGSVYSYNPLFSEMYIDKAYFIDKSLGLKDNSEYNLGLVNGDVTLYYDKDTSSSYKTIRNTYLNSFIILEASDNYIKVQNDYSMNSNGYYNPEKCILYIKPKQIDYIETGRSNNITYNIYSIDYKDIDENIGIISLYSKKEFNVDKEFVYSDISGIDISGYVLMNDTYVPKYKRIKEIKLEGLKYPSIINNKVNTENIMLHIIYEDNSSKKIDCSSENIISASNKNNETNLNVMYKGVTNQININGSFDINDDSIDSISDFKEYSKYNYSSLSFEDVSNFDNRYKLDDTISTYIRDNDFDFSVEGINPNFIYYESSIFPTVINTYYFDVERINNSSKLNEFISNFNLSYVDSFSVKIYRSLYHLDLISPIIMQVKLSQRDQNTIYTVYHKEKDGTFTKLPVSFSNNYVRFMTIDDGDFYIYKYNGASSYNLEDSSLSIQIDNNGKDYYEIILDGLVFSLSTIFGYFVIAVYYILRRRDERSWKDFKNSLQKVELPQEEKQNN